MERRIELFCIWCGPLFVLLFGLGWLISGFVPPPSAAEGPARIADFYRTHIDQLRIGMLLTLLGTGAAIPFIVVLARELRGSSSERSILTDVQTVAGILLLVGVLFTVVIIATLTLRPGRSPELIQALNDVGFTTIMWAFVPATVEAIAVGCAVLIDRSTSPRFPRWIGYFSLGAGAIYTVGAPTLYVKRGAFGWGGVLTFWLVFIVFGLWVLLLSAVMMRRRTGETQT